MDGERGYTPRTTVNTASDREVGFERGMAVGYLDIAIDAMVHLKERTSAGRAWLLTDAQLEEVLGWLTAQREEVLRKERVDGRPVRGAGKSSVVDWIERTNGGRRA